MFSTLPASRNAGKRAPGWTAASVMVHAAIVTTAAIATRQATQNALEPPRAQIIHYIEPIVRHAQRAQTPLPVGRLPNNFSIELPALPSLTSHTFDPSRLLPMTIEIGSGLPIGSAPSGQNNGVFTSQAVDRIVAALRTNPPPVYPPSLRAANLEGDVLVRFVVDTAGRVERNSIVVLQATHDLFADAVRVWLPQTRYEPAQAAGLPVRQLVEQRVGFTLRR